MWSFTLFNNDVMRGCVLIPMNRCWLSHLGRRNQESAGGLSSRLPTSVSRTFCTESTSRGFASGLTPRGSEASPRAVPPLSCKYPFPHLQAYDCDVLMLGVGLLRGLAEISGNLLTGKLMSGRRKL